MPTCFAWIRPRADRLAEQVTLATQFMHTNFRSGQLSSAPKKSQFPGLLNFVACYAYYGNSHCDYWLDYNRPGSSQTKTIDLRDKLACDAYRLKWIKGPTNTSPEADETAFVIYFIYPFPQSTRRTVSFIITALDVFSINSVIVMHSLRTAVLDLSVQFVSQWHVCVCASFSTCS